MFRHVTADFIVLSFALFRWRDRAAIGLALLAGPPFILRAVGAVRIGRR